MQTASVAEGRPRYAAEVRPTTAPNPWLAALGLWLLGLLTHAGRVAAWPEPAYWDVSYYRGVAASVARGEGAVTGAVWNLLHLPEALPAPADLYWQPLPSRVLVPGEWLWPGVGATAVAVLLASLWGPLAWAIARRLGMGGRLALGAGLAAVVGGAFARQASAADCFGLVGALGGGATLAAAGGRWRLAALACAGVALSRSDGLLFSLALATAFRGWRGVAVALSGPVAAAAWQLRNVSLLGDAAIALRQATSRARTIDELLLGTPPDVLGAADRFALVASSWPGIAMAWVLPTALVGALLVGIALARGHGGPLRRPLLLYWLALPPLLYLLAPGAAHHGALYRSGAAIFPALCAVAVLGLVELNRAAVRARGYAPAFVPGLVALCYVGGSLFLGRTTDADALPADICAPLAQVPQDATVFAWDPLAVSTACGHQAVLLLRAMGPDTAADLARRYDIRYAVLAPPGWEEGDIPTGEHMPALLPGWTARGPGLWESD